MKKSQRYGFTGMILVDTFVLLILFFYGLSYLVPPKEKGVTIRFGNSNFGSNIKKVQPIKKEEKKKDVKKEKKTPDKKSVKNIKKNKVLTQKDISYIKKDSTKKPNKISQKTIKENKKVRSVVDNFIKKNNNPNKKVASAINNIINRSKGRGEDNLEGEKGSDLGDLNVDNYTGIRKGGNYRLGNRRVLKKVRPIYDCEAEGVVVVSIWVNSMGDVIKAEAGSKGTTNPDSCLFKVSEEAAMNTKWEAMDGSSNNIQEGQIIYNFKIIR